MPEWMNRLIYRSTESPRERLVTALSKFLEESEDVHNMDTDLRKDLVDTIQRFSADPELSEEKLGKELQAAVFRMFPEDEGDVHRVLSQIHANRALEGHQPDWNGIVLVKLLRTIEKETGRPLFH